MSYDIKLTQHDDGTYPDIQVDNSGNISIVENRNKIVQDVYKILLTPKGGNYFHPTYGCGLDSLIGRKNVGKELHVLCQLLISEALSYLTELQNGQQLEQYLSREEELTEIIEITG